MSPKECSSIGNCDFEDDTYELCTWTNTNEKTKKSIPKTPFNLINGTLISIKCKGNNKYVSAAGAGLNPLIADKSDVLSWEIFKYIKNDDGTSSIIAMVNGKFVSGLTTGLIPFDYMHADQLTQTMYTNYELILNADDSYSFRSPINKKFVSASNSGFSPLHISEDTVGQSGFESFYMEPIKGELNNVYDWEIYVPNGLFGQVFDHTLENSEGHFILSNGATQGDFSRLYSQLFEKTSGTCMSFYYYFNGGLNTYLFFFAKYSYLAFKIYF